MGFIQSLIDGYKRKKQERNDTCDRLIKKIDNVIADMTVLFEDKEKFIDPQQAEIWEEQHTDLFVELSRENLRGLKGAVQYKNLLKKSNILLEESRLFSKRILQHNNNVANNRIRRAYELIDKVEGRKLDHQQMTCIVKEVHNHLVIAGAGTGKTTTVVGKIKYLLKSDKFQAEDILVLSFTNASAAEMCERIRLETGADIAACTFHKLGLNIISKVEGVIPKISKLNLQNFIKEQLRIQMQYTEYLGLLSTYLLFNRVVEKSEFEFKTEREYREYLSMNPPTTMNNETVKSYGEMDIANFLAQNRIRYIYEHPYEMDTRTSEYGQYYPDFYLPDYNIYIEYFGIDRDGNVPPYFKGKNGMSATEEYQASMKWKRQLHRNNNTVLLECFAYEKFDGILLDSLEKKLKDASVELNPRTTKELWEQISLEGESVLDGIVELFETLINLIKSNGDNIATVRSRNAAGVHHQANNIILSLVEPIFIAYCTYLKEHEEIDFNDMINLAAQYVQQGKFSSPYKYVIVDEYQDISRARFGLLNSLRQSRDYDLFCVGDDWQSIYRFAGSDIGYILNFEKHWGATEISKIETTYRFSQKMIDISGGFVMKNPAQIIKKIRGRDDASFPLGEISGYNEKCAIEFMVERLNDLPEGSSVFFIGRYSFDEKILSDSGMLECRYNNAENTREIIYRKRQDLKMSFVTAHKAKGLQADYVFIINNKKSRMGFPSKIQDSPIYNLLLDKCEQFPYAEERRLYYVSLTRAKKKAFFVTVNGQESEFALELKRKYEDELKREQFTCPKCGGRLIKRTGQYGDFLGCSNYSSRGCKYTRNIVSRNSIIRKE